MTLLRTTLRTFAKTFARDEDGATAIEYGLFAALIGAVIVAGVATLGGQTKTGFSNISAELSAQGIDAPASGS